MMFELNMEVVHRDEGREYCDRKVRIGISAERKLKEEDNDDDADDDRFFQKVALQSFDDPLINPERSYPETTSTPGGKEDWSQPAFSSRH